MSESESSSRCSASLSSGDLEALERLVRAPVSGCVPASTARELARLRRRRALPAIKVLRSEDSQPLRGHLECSNPDCQVGCGRSLVIDGLELKDAPCHGCGERLILRVPQSRKADTDAP